MKSLKSKLIFFLSSTCILYSFNTIKVGNTKYLPILFFKENSLEYDTLFNYPENTENIKDTSLLLNFISMKLIMDSTLFIEINGFSDKKELKDYSKQRMNKVYTYFIKQGINKKKIICKSNGKKKPYITEKIINKATNNNDKMLLRRFNRRICFYIYSNKK